MTADHPRLWVVRHGETEWSRSGRYTGLTDLELTREGRRQAEHAGTVLQATQAAGTGFDLVLTSPLRRAAETAVLAGFDAAERTPLALEWDYGDYEGIESAQIRRDNPGYLIWDRGVPNGETLVQVAARADALIARVRQQLETGGNAIVFTHGHFSRILAARWLGMDPGAGRHFLLGTAGICRLGWDKDTPAVEAWGI